MTALQMVGFDADDTLWHSETYYQEAQAQFESLLVRYIDVGDARVREQLLATERANLRLFGYGAKGMTLSMVETAIALTEARIARISGKVGVVTAQNGPAATLLVAPLAEALKSSVPIVALVQEVERPTADRNAFQELDHIALFGGCAKWIRRVTEPSRVEDYVDKFARLRIDALNHALEGIPEDRVRYHLCWGSWHGPHTHDLPFEHIIALMLQVKAQCYSFEAANVRHEHEWRLWERTKLPDGKMILPGVVSHASNLIEHPELIADRIMRFARLVGRENVIAGSDCGFSTFARSALTVHPTVTWAKFQAMAEGARLASEHLGEDRALGGGQAHAHRATSSSQP